MHIQSLTYTLFRDKKTNTFSILNSTHILKKKMTYLNYFNESLKKYSLLKKIIIKIKENKMNNKVIIK